VAEPEISALVSAPVAYGALAETYDVLHSDPISLAEDQIVKEMLYDVIGKSGPGHVVVDLGCGTGKVLDLLPSILPSRYFGFDLSWEMLARAKAKHPQHLFTESPVEKVDTVFRAAMAQDFVGAVVSTFGALSYSPDPLAAFSAARAVLRREGRLFVMLYGPRYLERPTYALKDIEVEHRRTWTAREFDLALTAVGFRGVRVSGLTMVGSKWPVSRPRWMESLLRFERATVLNVRPDLAYWLIGEAYR
jgi:SAM-dependent methyltransferase